MFFKIKHWGALAIRTEFLFKTVSISFPSSLITGVSIQLAQVIDVPFFITHSILSFISWSLINGLTPSWINTIESLGSYFSTC